MATKAKIISYAIPLASPSLGCDCWRVRFSFESACGRSHTATQENVWASGENYFTEIRDVRYPLLSPGVPCPETGAGACG